MNISKKIISALGGALITLMASSSVSAANYTTPVNNSGLRQVSPEQSFYSQDGRFRFTFQQSDGNFVLYQGNTPLWATYVYLNNYYNGIPVYPAYVNFQTDGNLVVYFWQGNPSNVFPVWASNTGGRGVTFDVQNDGNAVIRNGSGQAIWSSNTCCH